MEKEWFGEDYDPQQSPWVRFFEYWNNRRTFNRIISPSSAGSRLLEIGVGSGSFLAFARSRGFQVTGCDLSGPICKLAERKFRLPVHHGAANTLPDGPVFDVVVMNHVLEHVPDPVALLREVQRKMKPGGVLHVAVPNVDSWESMFPGWTGFEPYHLVLPRYVERYRGTGGPPCVTGLHPRIIFRMVPGPAANLHGDSPSRGVTLYLREEEEIYLAGGARIPYGDGIQRHNHLAFAQVTGRFGERGRGRVDRNRAPGMIS